MRRCNDLLITAKPRAFTSTGRDEHTLVIPRPATMPAPASIRISRRQLTTGADKRHDREPRPLPVASQRRCAATTSASTETRANLRCLGITCSSTTTGANHDLAQELQGPHHGTTSSPPAAMTSSSAKTTEARPEQIGILDLATTLLPARRETQPHWSTTADMTSAAAVSSSSSAAAQSERLAQPRWPQTRAAGKTSVHDTTARTTACPSTSLGPDQAP